MAIKPILFNTEMVRAILNGRKTCTRRLVKPQPDEKHSYPLGFVTASTEKKEVGCFGFGTNEYGGSIQYVKPPYAYEPGDILYVRETWYKSPSRYMYRADYSHTERFYTDGKEVSIKWHPSIHMPKEAARIWLKVTDVRVERLQDMDWRDALDEGVNTQFPRDKTGEYIFDENPIDDFIELWNSTIKKSDLDRYGWDASPWVWVIEFERCEKPENL